MSTPCVVPFSPSNFLGDRCWKCNFRLGAILSLRYLVFGTIIVAVINVETFKFTLRKV